jgi:hypothetical protein
MERGHPNVSEPQGSYFIKFSIKYHKIKPVKMSPHRIRKFVSHPISEAVLMAVRNLLAVVKTYNFWQSHYSYL